jgi:hypothetical protein
MNKTIDRKQIFDAVRRMLDRGFSQEEVQALDAAIDLALVEGDTVFAPHAHRLGTLSEKYESGGRGPGTVSDGKGDPGGMSYGLFQMASKTGTVAAFLGSEGARWAAEFGKAAPGSASFTATWKAIATREAEVFAEAQRGFIERSHYRPAVGAVFKQIGLDLNARADAVRDAVWSVAVQHGGAAEILAQAVREAEAVIARGQPGYDRALLEAIYPVRSAYVRRIADRSVPVVRQTLMNVIERRYPDELGAALAMLASSARVA